jgi:integrase
VRALSAFISSGGSRYTTRTYAYSVLGFWEWLDAKRGQLPTPDELSREDAVAYERWLRESGENLTRYRLSVDPARSMDLAIYDYVRGNPGITVLDIRRMLLSSGRYSVPGGLYLDQSCDGLHKYLGALVIGKVLRREPTMEQLRSDPEFRRISSEDAQDIFRYFIDPGHDQSQDRVCGNATRIGVLAAFWTYMASQGENLPGSAEPLIRFNIWLPVLRRVREQASSYQAERRAVSTPGGSLFSRVLATTYRSTHGDRALEAAEAAIRGEVLPGRRGKFSDLRDRAMLLVMLQAGGPRASEVQNMRRGDLSADLSELLIRGKRNKVRRVPVPPAAADAIRQMTERISTVVERMQAKGRRVDRFRDLLSENAPLLPAIRYWGANKWSDDSCGLTRAGIAMRLRYLAKRAGFKSGSREFAMMHPHGIRRLFAKQHMASGTPLNVLQALMGHASGATTLRYAEERDVAALRTGAFGASGAEPAFEAAPAPREAAKASLPAAEPARGPQKPETAAETPREPVPEPIPTPTVVRVLREPSKPRKKKTECVVVAPTCRALPVGPERTLCDVYETNWGEEGDRTRIQFGKELGELKGKATGLVVYEEQSELEEPEIGSFGETRRLTHVYCGRETGLVWWSGTNGDLKPELPVASTRQIGERCSPDDRSELCSGLVALWNRWMDDDSKGPTAAGALALWTAEMIETAGQVEIEVRARAGEWVWPMAPIEETVLGGSKRYPEARSVFREHQDQRILEWFEKVAWQFRTSVSRETGVRKGELGKSARVRKVLGGDFKPPDWYALEDPLAALEPSDRADALDLAAALTRGTLVDERARWGPVSRKALSDLFQAMVSYDRALENVRTERHRVKHGDPDGSIQRSAAVRQASLEQAKKDAARVAVVANTLLQSLGVEGANLIKLSEQRVRVRRAEAAKRRPVWKWRLDLVRELFGPEPADDLYVQLASRHADNPPLQDFRSLLDPDWKAGTIRQPPEFIREWAREHGTHSECVARRLARHMWELFSASRGEKRPFDKASVLVNYVAAMSAYRVPCPAAQERQLRDLLRWEKLDIPIYEVWRRAFGTRLSAEEERKLLEARWEGEDEDEDTYEPSYFPEEFMQANPSGLDREKARKSTPNPLLLLLLLLPFVPP